MHQRILIIGDSPVSLLLARQLDQDLARLAHLEVTLIRRDLGLTYWPDMRTILGAHPITDVTTLFKDVAVKKAVVKQINLPDCRVVTDRGNFNYDVIVLDLTPTFNSTEVEKIAAQCRRLLGEIQAKLNTGAQPPRWRVAFSGDDIQSWQLALALSGDLAVHPTAIQRSVLVQAEPPPSPALKEFLVRSGVNFNSSVAPKTGFTVGRPTSPIKNRSVRGAILDEGDNFILNQHLNPEGHPECIVVTGSGRLTSNLWRVDQTLAGRITNNIERFLEGKEPKPLELPRSSGLVTSTIGIFSWLCELESWRWRAKVIAYLDRQFYRRVVGG